jgi:hypothetical protein
MHKEENSIPIEQIRHFCFFIVIFWLFQWGDINPWGIGGFSTSSMSFLGGFPNTSYGWFFFIKNNYFTAIHRYKKQKFN